MQHAMRMRHIVISSLSGFTIFFHIISYWREPGSVVGIATAYWLEGPGIESRWGEIFRTCPDRP